MDATRPLAGLAIFDGLLTPSDLSELQDLCAAAEFCLQRLGPGSGRDGLPERRSRADLSDPRIPELLWARLGPNIGPLHDWYRSSEAAPQLEPPIEAWKAFGCNPRTRIYRYEKGDRFAPHLDEAWSPDSSVRSFLTVLVYLPPLERCLGGVTLVEGEVVDPIPGRIVVFDHHLPHEGRPVEAGQKVVLRSDVLGRSRGS